MASNLGWERMAKQAAIWKHLCGFSQRSSLSFFSPLYLGYNIAVELMVSWITLQKTDVKVLMS